MQDLKQTHKRPQIDTKGVFFVFLPLRLYQPHPKQENPTKTLQIDLKNLFQTQKRF